ncbi:MULTISPECIES: type II toxin-antitoxin system VapC family toxin [Mesorhizobium]|uniref:type II toxin-antitoxin system VapC family toxin n=1 Tax=Mesorhizobium TaxID=68287 RepID=UPI0007ED4C39|nr:MULTISPECIES: DNA-binding protein [Mesorhizobium]TPJ40434.1 DNA-binding protein [Mesorhizobium sp. B2-6-6]ARP67186.1 DNA-binding protein [Mesorhizobium sp. WSM1497]MCA0002766.1 DNA-binding protein [Mesorhizobium sp. B264B2A]MCA0009083.1 DNA-binding protein [Mesorhizobium sp. B264B1B]MCA0014520.1 DNA-binding protein [Mesorhizobium sp. B294B1A1]
MADFDFGAALRWSRFDPQKTLSRRPDTELPIIGNLGGAGQELLLDTCVYIDGLQGRAPDAVADLLDVRQVNHSTVAIQELMHTVGVLDPKHSGTSKAVKQIGSMIKDMPSHRVFAPDPDVLGRAALLSGMLCRLQGYKHDSKLRALQDCVLFLHAQKMGFSVLTGNVSDFDYLLQLIPKGRVLMYRPI